MLTRIATFAKDKKCCERRESAAKDVKMLRKTIYVANDAKDTKDDICCECCERRESSEAP
jgi:hypothetical protein